MSKKNSPAKNFFRILIIVIISGFIVWFFLRRDDPNKDLKVIKGNVIATNTPTATPTPSAQIDLPQNKTINAAILMYHHIGPVSADADNIRKGLTVSASTFEQQMQKLKDGGFNVITLNELYNRISTDVPSKTVVLTFDDGYEDNASVAEPILQKFGFHGTFFIITSKIGTADYMSADQIKNLLKDGNEIGSHTVHHIDLATVSGVTLENELKDSKTYLDDLLNQKTVSFCYPSGKYSDEAKADLKKLGYKMAVTTEASKGTFSTDDIYGAPRYRVNPGSTLSFLPK